MRLKKSIAAVGVVALMTIAACGGGGDNESTDIGDTSGGGGSGGIDPAYDFDNPEPWLEKNVEYPAPDVKGAEEGGIVEAASVKGVQTMDPAEAYFAFTGSLLNGLVTRSLTQYKYVDGEMVLVPDLATDLGHPNDDYTKWEFTVRDDIKWEDGTPVTMDDWVLGIERSMDAWTDGSKTGEFPNGATYSADYFKNGYNTNSDKSKVFKGPYSEPGESCECVSYKGNTLTIEMAKPFPEMPYWGSFPAMGPYPSSQKDTPPSEYALHPWALGPYKFDGQINGDKSFKLVRNEHWDPKTDAVRHQYVDGWNFKADYGEAAVFEKGMLEDSGKWANGIAYDNVTSENIQGFKQENRLATGPGPCTYLAQINMRDPKWNKDIRVRQALAYAWAHEDITKASGEAWKVTRLPGTMILPPGVAGSQPDYNPFEDSYVEQFSDDPDEKQAAREANIEKARELLEEAGAMGTEVSFYYAKEDQNTIASKDQKVKALEEAGFKPKPIQMATRDDIYDATQDPNQKVDIKDGLGWCSDWPSGSSWFGPVLGTNGAANYSYFSNKKVDQRIEEIRAMPLDEQDKAWGELDKEIMEKHLPVFNNTYSGVAIGYGSNVGNMLIDSEKGYPVWKDIFLKNQ